MIRLIFLVIIFSCTSCIFNKSNGIYHNENLSYIDITFVYKSQIRDDMMFAVVDSNESFLNKQQQNFTYRTIEIEHNKYLKFYHELKRIRCFDEDGENFESFIEINILDKGNIAERFRLKTLNQIQEYIKVSNNILGENNFNPIEKYYMRK